MYRKILVVVDDRPVAHSTIVQAVELASSLHAGVHFLYYLPNFVYPAFDIPPVIGLLPDEFHRKASAHARDTLRTACAMAEHAGVHSNFSTIPASDRAQTIADYAFNGRFDLIVVGTDGENAVVRLLNGSVVPSLISHAQVPVLVCKDIGPDGQSMPRSRASIRARRKRSEMMDRKWREAND